MKALVLPIAEEHYGFALSSVQQVISSPRVTHLPAAEPALLGLINVRGEIVPLFDLAVLTDVGERGASAFAILVETSHGLAALGVAAMPESVELDEASGSEGFGEEARVFPVDGHMVTLLEVENLLVRGRAGLPRAS